MASLMAAQSSAEFSVAACEARTQTYLPRLLDAVAASKEAKAPAANKILLGAGWEVYHGKVRDVYTPRALSDFGKIVLVATGRQSAFDRHLATVPFKGAVLNGVSKWWFVATADVTANHVIACPCPDVCVARRTTCFPIEFVVRGYVTGSTDTSLWTHYARGERTYCGHSFPDGLLKNAKLPAPLCTPTTKDADHDAPISAAEIVASGRMTQAEWAECEAKALAVFQRGQEIAASRGLILVDTKYEFGRTPAGAIILIDEVHTPDSSRYWLAASYGDRFAKGLEPENIDKEFLRLWYREQCDPYAAPTLPEAPDDLIAELARRYILLYELITHERFDFDVVAPDEYESRIRRALQDDAAAPTPEPPNQP